MSLSGTRSDVAASVQHEGGGVWRATYVPQAPGTFLLNVMWADRQVGWVAGA